MLEKGCICMKFDEMMTGISSLGEQRIVVAGDRVGGWAYERQHWEGEGEGEGERFVDRGDILLRKVMTK